MPILALKLIILTIILVSATAASAAADCKARFPLRYASPQTKSVSVDKLVELTEWIGKTPARILSLTISRDGTVIYELYSSRINRDDAHYLMSVTKSATSALVGAAIQSGELHSVDRSISELLPPRFFDEGSFNRFKQVTLRDVMGMSALDAQVPPHLINSETKQRQKQFFNTPNRLEFSLRQKLLPHVGMDFQYTDITPYLAGGSIQYATGLSLFDYAMKNLFGAMDFRNAEWMHSDQAGNSNPSYGLRLRPIDMQKFGLLYLNEGCWDNKQLLSSDWVRQSFTPWIRSGPNNYRPNYGWFWWTNWRNNGWTEHQANGWRGQRISVFPEKNMVVTMTGDIEDGTENSTYERIINEFVIPSVEVQVGEQHKTNVDLQMILSNVWQGKNALSAPIEDRMVPSSKRKEKPQKFKP